MKPVQFALAAVLAALTLPARADAVLDWNATCAALVTEAKLGTPPAVRAMAIVHHASFEAAKAASAAGADIESAIAAAHRGTLARLMPAQQASLEAAYKQALARVADGPAKAAGLAIGERAASAALALRADDAALPAETYRPHAVPGAYVPTASPAVPQWGKRKPWVLADAAQVRPGPPPPLAGTQWAREFDEVKALGGKSSASRSAEQAEMARFWEYSLPSIYHGVVRTLAQQPGRTLVDNARLFAAAAVAMDDALIAVFDAKYHYHFWRPSTAIRNADADGNDATEREAGWSSFIEAPMHPEYPSGHAVLAGAVGAVLKAESGTNPLPVLATSSPSAKGATRRWSSVEDFVAEVSLARVYSGIHYRFSVDTGAGMGWRIGDIAARAYARTPS